MHMTLEVLAKTAGARSLRAVAKAVDKKADPGGAGMPCNFNEGGCGRARRRQNQ